MKVTFTLKYVTGDDPKWTADEIKDAIVNTDWNPDSENPHYHNACARRRDIRLALTLGDIEVEYTLSREECLELLDVKEVLDICVKYGFMERDIAELATWTKAGVSDYIRRKMNLVRVDWLEVWDEMRKIASQKVSK